MKRLALLLLLAALPLAGCRTSDSHGHADSHWYAGSHEEELSLKEMRADIIAQMRAAGATPAQIREVERQLDAMARQIKALEHQAERMEKGADH